MRRKSWVLLLVCLLMAAALTSTALAAAGTLNIPSGTKVIDSMAFYGDTRIERVNVPSGVTTIGTYAFGAATALREVNLPTTITAMDTTVFAGCGQITVNTNYPSTTATLVRNMVAAGQTNISAHLWQDSVTWGSAGTAQADVHMGEVIFLAYTATNAGTYTFASSCALDTYGYLYDSSRRQLAYNDNGSDGVNFSISYNLSAGQKVYVGVKYVSPYYSGAVSVSVKAPGTTLTVGSNSIPVAAGQTVRRSFTAPTAGDYTFYSTDSVGSTGSSDTYGYLYDANGNLLTSNDDGGEGLNFSITYTLTAGQTVSLGVRYLSESNSGTINVVVAAPAPVPTSDLRVGNNSIYIGAGQTVRKTFVAPRSASYTFYSTGSVDTQGALYDSNGVLLAEHDDYNYSQNDTNFSISHRISAGQTVTLAVNFYSGSASGTINVVVQESAAVEMNPAASSIHYRALLVANNYSNNAAGINPLPKCAYDGLNFNYMLNFTIPSYTTTLLPNATANQMLSAIPTAFAGATANDISLFYYSGHGYSESGNLVGYDGSPLTPVALRRTLDQIPGKKIIILDSCFSGSFINKNGDTVQTEMTYEDVQAAEEAFISAFLGADMKTANLLDETPYYVITASSKDQESWCHRTENISVFTKYLLYGCGYNANAGSLGSLPADTNGDRKISLDEAFNYAYSRANNYTVSTFGEYQYARCYPSGSSQVLFSFTN